MSRYTEEEAKGLIKKVLYALRYLHEHNIVHRDLKLENILFDSMDRDAELKICDFGLSQHYHHGEHMHSTLGTPYYIAPEVLRGDYDEKCDLWSVGVICFMLLSGTPPFPGHNNKEIMEAVKRGEYNFDPSRWKHVRQPAMDFISALLKMNPEERPSCAEALTLDWLTEAKVTVEEQLEEDPVLGKERRALPSPPATHPPTCVRQSFALPPSPSNTHTHTPSPSPASLRRQTTWCKTSVISVSSRP